MLNPDCTLQDVKDAIQDAKKLALNDTSYNQTAAKNLSKLKLLHKFMELGGEGIDYWGGKIRIDEKYLVSLIVQKWSVIGGNGWWYHYGNPVDLLHKLRGSEDA